MKAKLILCLVISLAILSGCKDNSPTGPDKPGEPFSDGLMPLKTGNQWTYKWYILDAVTGEIRREETGSDQKQIVSEYVRGSFKGNAYDGYSWDIQPLGAEQQPDIKWLYLNKPDGLYQMGAITKTDTSINNILQYKYPVKKGDSWLVPHLLYEPHLKFFIYDTVRYECTDTAAIFQTPLGDFKCYVYRHLEDLGDDIVNDWEYFEYYKPGFGMVGIIIKDYYPRNGKSTFIYKMVLQATNLSN